MSKPFECAQCSKICANAVEFFRHFRNNEHEFATSTTTVVNTTDETSITTTNTTTDEVTGQWEKIQTFVLPLQQSALITYLQQT